MKYAVSFEPFSERHFIKNFSKKHKGAWERTLNGLILEFTYVDLLFQKSIAETISVSGDVKICKTEFKIAGTEMSRHASGNRCIVAIHQNEAVVCVLMVYSKADIATSNETAAWKNIIKANYPKYRDVI
ncbi:hypothetical protein C4572_03170 [Candidatus Parcubacteria bacterium]|nr:MAG: hypothetical protein C4572_03170 [Candidatus Parcubacteria bacterium]